MLHRVKFDGYRLLDDFEADLGQLTVVIGANATGKSSLLDALSLISHAMEWTDLEGVVGARGGMWSIPNAARECDEIGWRLTFSKPKFHERWERMPLPADTPSVYELRIARGRAGEVKPRYECLRYEQPKPGHTQPFKMLEAQEGRVRIFDPSTGRLTPFNAPEPAAPGAAADLQGATGAAKPSLAMAQMRFEHQFPIPTWVRFYFSWFCFYRGFELGRGSLLRTKPAEILLTAVLNESGENLGTVLHEILGRGEFRDTAGELREWLAAGYPHFVDISAETAFGGEPRVLVRVREAGMRRGTEIWELSDGMLRFILLCAALLNPTGPGFIAIDEPETGLHPKLLPIVADLIRAASERTQVLVTTHSPQLLSCFDLSDIAVMARDASRATWHRPGSRQTLREMLESQLGGTLGELHASGELEALR